MPGKKRVVSENVEVENVTEVTQEVKPGLLDKLKSGMKNFWSKHKTKIVVGTALVGAGMLAGAKLVKEEDEEEVAYLVIDGNEIELVEIEDYESNKTDEEDEVEDNDEKETED